jgi:predicted  nucleic acid-binding Zn-ribbon protein
LLRDACKTERVETEALRQLMEADRWIDRVTAQRSHLAEMVELETLEGELRRWSRELAEAKQVQTPVRANYDAATLEAQRLAKRAGELERALASTTANPRELAAIHKELEHVRQLLAAAEDRELELMIEVEPLDEAVASIKAQAQPAVAHRAELQAAILELQSTLDEELVALRASRAARSAQLSPALLARYENLLKRVGTSGAAQVEEGRCDGCRILLSPLDLDRWKALGEDSFMPCPECGRLLLP